MGGLTTHILSISISTKHTIYNGQDRNVFMTKESHLVLNKAVGIPKYNLRGGAVLGQCVVLHIHNLLLPGQIVCMSNHGI